MRQPATLRLGKTVLSLLLVGVLLIGCASCKTTVLVRFMDQDGNIIGNSNSGDTAETPAANADTAAPAQSASSSSDVSSINLEVDDGILKYVRFEKAGKEVTDEPNAYLFVYEYTNKKAEPANVQSTFYVQYFQNGTELNDPMSYTVKGEQGELASARSNQATQGGSVTFGEIVKLKDESPVTIYVKQRGKDSAAHQSMVVALSSAGEAPTEAPAPDPVKISFNSPITHPFTEITFTDTGVKESLEFVIKSGIANYHIGPTGESGKKYVYLNGTIKNPGKEPIQCFNFFVGEFDLGGYKYKCDRNSIVIYNDSGESLVNEIEPMATYKFIMYAAVPNEVADSFTSGTYRFGFVENFDNHTLSSIIPFEEDPIIKCDYQYILTIK